MAPIKIEGTCGSSFWDFLTELVRGERSQRKYLKENRSHQLQSWEI